MPSCVRANAADGDAAAIPVPFVATIYGVISDGALVIE